MAEVSVVMSVYNGDRYLREAVDSILNQAFTDFEFIIVDDGSTDSTSEILAGYATQDPRIMLVRNHENIGQTKSLNEGLARAQGEYIARQDADDVSLPERLSAQVAFLQENLDVGLVGSAYDLIDAEGDLLCTVHPPCAPDELSSTLPEENCICGASVLFRARCMDSVGLYREQVGPVEDYDLWLRIAERFRVANLANILYRVRFRPDSICVRQLELQTACLKLVKDLARMRRRHGQERVPLDEDGILSLGSLPTPEPRTLARRYLWHAYLFYLLGDEESAKAHFASAIAADVSLSSNNFELSNRLLGRAQAITEQTQSHEAGARFISTLLTGPQGSAVPLNRLAAKTLGAFHVAAASESYAQAKMGLVRRHLVLAVRHDRQWLRNKGVLSIGLESLIGRRAARLTRSLVATCQRDRVMQNVRS